MDAGGTAMKKVIHFLPVLILLVKSSFAHVGSPDVAIEGMAGPYHLLVSIKPPDVIPGTAMVTVFLQNASGATISTQPVYFFSGREGAPSADILPPVAGAPGTYKGIVWLMQDGSSSVLLHVKGRLGEGELIVPVVAVSTAQKKLPASTGIVLILLGIFLFVLMVTLVGASVGEGITNSGESLPVHRKRSKRIAFAVAALLSSLVVYGGNAWWKGWAGKYSQFMFKPMHATYRVDGGAGKNFLRMTIDTAHSQRKASLSYIVPDHGKLMHLFLMRMPALDVFAHLHPVREDTASFMAILPPYTTREDLAFADIVYSSGFTETLKDTLTLEKDLAPDVPPDAKTFNPDVPLGDPDDTYVYALPDNLIGTLYQSDNNSIICGKPGAGVKMKDGSEMVMEGPPQGGFSNGQLYQLHFSVYDDKKQPARLEPYLGMQGHAVIVKNDGSVYIHIHPVGTYSVTAQTSLLQRVNRPENEYNYPDRQRFRDSVDKLVTALGAMPEQERNSVLMRQMNMPADSMSGMKMDNTVSFPYTFPQPGLYRIWIQVKRNGRVLTAAFDREVK